MAVKMRAALQGANEVIGKLLVQLDELKTAASNTDGSLRTLTAEANGVRAEISRLLATKPKAKKRKVVRG